MDLDRYLERINYQGSRSPSLDTLKALQLAYIYSVPFENLDIHLSRPIELSVEKIYHKIVEQQRGGFCYESNTLFHALLELMGFEVKYVAATMLLEISMNVEFGHMALIVSLDEDYLVDVGNGQSCLQPMQIDADDVARFEDIDYRVSEFEDGHALHYKEVDAEWLPRFSFTSTSRRLQEYENMCHITQTSPESHFTQKRVVTLAKPDGRITLADRDLEIKDSGKLERRLLQSNQEYRDALQTYFNIHLSSFPETW
ncbi:MAG: arylamine N-acetyltransferase [Gammaproteobacteria bacterium]|nr:arylamine N-acetyltransferase [Gammaproteobacteria bacterium]